MTNQTQLFPFATACILATCFALPCTTSLNAKIVFSESFESPLVSGFSEKSLPDNENWVGSTKGYGATNRGLYNETFAWPDTDDFNTPYGEQAYLLNGPNNGMTTAVGATGAIVQKGVPITVLLNAAALEGNENSGYKVQLVAFDESETNEKRLDVRGGIAGTVLASTEGNVSTSDFSEAIVLNYTPKESDPIGKELGIRLLKGDSHVLYDNIRLVVGQDSKPSPESGVIVPSGKVDLSWTNKVAQTGQDVWVDVWFGTDPESDFKKLLQADLNKDTATANAPVAGTYYWRVDTYLNGSASGTPETGDIFKFIVDDTDGDGLTDAYELANTSPTSPISLNPDDDLEHDGKGDGLTNAEERFYGTDPNNADTDGDQLEDGPELAGVDSRPATSPIKPDTDDDGLSDLVESNTGKWDSAADTGTNPVNPDSDQDGLVDGVETHDGKYVDSSATGSDPFVPDTDGDGVLDWYEVTSSFTDPNDKSQKPPLPYPLPDPDESAGLSNKPVKVYIMSGQSNMVGFGTVKGDHEKTLETIVKVQNKFPNLIDDAKNWTVRKDVRYRGVVSDEANAQLSPANLGSMFGPELGFGYILGHYHDEPVLLLKSCTGNRGLGWDILPPGSPSYEYDGEIFAGYGEGPSTRAPGEAPNPNPGWWAGFEWDRFFTDESEWVRPQKTPVVNVVDVLDNFATEYPDWAEQGFEIAGFVWWQGDKDRYKMGYASRYEHNLVNLIDQLRDYYSKRYPGKVATKAPFVLATLGQTKMGDTSHQPEAEILKAKMAVDGESGKYPRYSGNVKTVYTYPISQGASNAHYSKDALTYLMVGDALGTAMVELLEE